MSKPVPDATDVAVFAADVAVFLHTSPSGVALREALQAELPPRDSDVPLDVAAHAVFDKFLPPGEIDAILAGLAEGDREADQMLAGAPKPRIRARPLEDAARHAAIILYNGIIPSPAVLPRKDLYAEIREYLLRHKLIAPTKKGTARISGDTIRIALGLKQRRSR